VEHVTLAEILRDQGYRTAAITDSGFVSRLYGFDQGFEIFHERRRWSLRETMAEVDRVIAADDGRPLFLFVQSYRMHTPYRIGPREDGSAYQRLVAAAEAPDGNLDLERLARGAWPLYLDAARDLDQAMENWFTPREAAGYFDNAWFVFTSDHGEEFFEHGDFEHGAEHWDVVVRIPLFLLGPGIEAGIRRDPAFLLDLPPTLLALPGVEVPPEWPGRDLWATGAAEPLHLYGLFDDTERLVVVDGDWKVYVTLDPEGGPEGEVVRAFDLSTDPTEARDLLESDADWVERLWRDARRRVVQERKPLVAPSRVDLPDDASRQLDDIGYGGK